MRCMSKCVVSRSTRVYTVLLFGITFGFALSTFLQSLSYSDFGKNGWTADYPSTYIQSAGKASFSNLDTRGSESDVEEIDIGGYYDYERLVLLRDEEEEEQQRINVAKNDHHNTETQTEREGDSLSNGVQDSALQKKMKYVNNAWQGRNVRETKNGDPVLRLSDELTPRRTLLIGIITSVSQLMSQTLAIQGTWAQEAKHVVYFTGEVQTLPHLPHGMIVVQLDGLDDKQAGWELKQLSVINYISMNYIDNTDWYLIIGDQTYVSPTALETELNNYDASMPVYLGRPLEEGREGGEEEEEGKNETDKLCNSVSGIVYSRGFIERLKPYLPVCWPGNGGGLRSLSGCISVTGLKCTAAKQTKEMFISGAKLLVESPQLFQTTHLSNAMVIHPVKYPKYMYRLHSYFKEIEYNTSIARAKSLVRVIADTHPFIPSHLRSSFDPTEAPPMTTPTEETTPPPLATASIIAPAQTNEGIVVRPRHTPKNKFEINNWEYFNQTRLMSVFHESPARGIIGGTREEARFALTKAIYLINQGRSQKERYVFDKLENGYHRIDPMRGSEFVLDFVFRKSSNHNVRIKKRVGILRAFHETVLPIDTPEVLPTVNYVTVLSGLNTRLETFLANYEKNVLLPGEDATLTIVLFEGPDASKVRSIVETYSSRYRTAKISIVDTQGEFSRGVGLHKGIERLKNEDLVLIVDIDFDVATTFLQRCRLNTVRGKQVYFPIFFKLYNPEFVSQYHRGNSSMRIARHTGHWAHYSFGMVCIFASDYHNAGGFDSSMKGWGEEDIDFMTRVISKDLEIFRAPDPGLIHNWHRKVCDKVTVSNPVAYDHCLMSKGENLADRIELAQYVFDSELKKGNLL